MRHLRLPGPLPCGLAALLLMALLPLIANPYILFIANELCIYVLLSLGLNLLVGYCGQLAFAQAALWGIGAYAAGLLRARLGIPFVVAIPAGIALTTVIGLLIAFPALRLSGHYLALATLAFAQFTTWVFQHWDAVTLGGGGFRVPLPQMPAFISPGLASYYAALACVVLAVLLAARIVCSRIGRAMIAVRDGELAAESLGINLLHIKLIAFGLSAACAGIAGGLQVVMMGFVSPETFDLPQMVLQQAMIVFGGLGSVAGSVIGAALLVGLQEGLRAFQGAQEIAFGGLLLGVVVLAPRGIAGYLRQHHPAWRDSYVATPRGRP
ncbi:MAG: branched-chain amino acid ABC transporter permease [Acetobacteraceae bacterium]|nr:branched-chain amino acid ABC transporter permease [Acetobacteraceae bacterium]